MPTASSSLWESLLLLKVITCFIIQCSVLHVLNLLCCSVVFPVKIWKWNWGPLEDYDKIVSDWAEQKLQPFLVVFWALTSLVPPVSRPGWVELWAAWSRTKWSLRSLLTQSMQWFCDSLICCHALYRNYSKCSDSLSQTSRRQSPFPCSLWNKEGLEMRLLFLQLFVDRCSKPSSNVFKMRFCSFTLIWSRQTLFPF